MLRGKKIFSVVALMGALALGAASNACTEPPVGPPSITIIQVGPTTYCIWICNYTAVAMPGQFCTCAINKLGVIANIKDVEVFRATIDGMMPDPCNPGGRLGPVGEWDFNPNPNLSATYLNAAGSGDWEGLLAATTGPIPPQTAISIKITLNVLPGTTTSQLVNAIDVGDPLFIGAGKATDASGTALVPGNFSLRAAGMIGAMIVPALGLVGLGVLGTGFAAAGVFAVRRRASLGG